MPQEHKTTVYMLLSRTDPFKVIRSQGRASRLFVNIPLPLAAALDIQAGELVRWQLLSRSDLRLVRLEAPTPAKGLKK